MNWTEICKDCGECCGLIPFTAQELNKYQHLVQEKYVPSDLFEGLLIPLTKSWYCVFLNKVTKRCLIYTDRPEVCRLQGTIPKLPCPRLKQSQRVIAGAER